MKNPKETSKEIIELLETVEKEGSEHWSRKEEYDFWLDNSYPYDGDETVRDFLTKSSHPYFKQRIIFVLDALKNIIWS